MANLQDTKNIIWYSFVCFNHITFVFMMQLNFTYEHELMKEPHKPLHTSNMLWEKFAFSTFCQAF